MNSSRIDLHVHSTASDGTFTPTEIVDIAMDYRLRAMALTDHDTIDGIAECKNAADKVGLEFIPGVELSTDYHGKELHVVGLYIDTENTELCDKLKAFVKERNDRNIRMANLLEAEGFKITVPDIVEKYGDGVITRAHFAKYLVDTNQVKDKKTVFSKYLGDKCRCFVDRELNPTVEAIKLIKRAGGIAILAHPVLYKYNKEHLIDILGEFKEAGLDGMEAVYSTNSPGDERLYRKICEELNLLKSGGSDFHGANKPEIKIGVGFGHMHIPYEFLEKIKEYRA